MSVSVDKHTLRRALVTALALCWFLAVWVGFGSALIASVRTSGGESLNLDLYVFLNSSDQLRRGEPLYATIHSLQTPNGTRPAPPNLNHPALAVALVPLAVLDRTTAFLIWTVLSIAAYLLAVVLALRELGLTRERSNLPLFFALALTLPGAIYSLQLAELGLLLALPVTIVWILLRRGHSVAAGMLLGALIALKLFLFLLLPLFLFRRDWRGLLAAVGGAIGLSLATLVITGPTAFYDWLATMRSIGWYTQDTNISLTGVLYRIIRPAADSPPALGFALTWGPVLLVGVAAFLLLRASSADARSLDRSFAVLLTLAILGSPLGWLYYLPILLPAFALLIEMRGTLPHAARRLVLAGVALLWLPHAFLSFAGTSALSQLTIGTTPTYGLIALVTGLMLTLPSALGDRGHAVRRVPAQVRAREATHATPDLLAD